jgi:hypothetical protein
MGFADKRNEVMDRNAELIKYVFHNNDVTDRYAALDILLCEYRVENKIQTEAADTRYNLPPGYDINDFKGEYDYLTQ